jgi:Protein of unknown function (DUF1207)
MTLNPCKTHTGNLLITAALLALSQPVCADAKVELLPLVDLYPDYIADPLRATFGLQSLYVDHSSIADTGKRRYFLRTGGSLPLLGSAQAGLDTPEWQVIGEAGIQGQFDKEYVADNIGWDGIYSLYYAHRLDTRSAWRIGSKHISSHVGDELIERTGRVRINYTREELRLGFAYNLAAQLLTYVDGGYAYNLGDKPLQAPWRLQLGMQLERPNRIWENQLGWYAAADLSSYEENDWQRNLTVQLGLSAVRGEHTWRFGIEYYHGRSVLGEFFQDREQYVGAALWIDI